MTKDQIERLLAAFKDAKVPEINDDASVMEAFVNMSAFATTFAEVGLVANGTGFTQAIGQLVKEKRMPAAIAEHASEFEDLLLQGEYRFASGDIDVEREITEAYETLIDALRSWANTLEATA